jgi:hypothetical protein
VVVLHLLPKQEVLVGQDLIQLLQELVQQELLVLLEVPDILVVDPIDVEVVEQQEVLLV